MFSYYVAGEPEENLEHAPKRLAAFIKSNPLKLVKNPVKKPHNVKKERTTGKKSVIIVKKLKNSKTQYGFEKGFMPEKIMAAVDYGEGEQFLIKWLFESEWEMVPKQVALIHCPQLVADFYNP